MSSRIHWKSFGSILSPLKNLQFLARPAVTESLQPRQAAPHYRGFHLNAWDECIGCSTCQKVCDNAAITMVEVPGLPADPVQGIRNLRPAIDYGRCCWCALCVDLCPTASISLSREYVHTCFEEEIDSYFMLPTEQGMHGRDYGVGWAKSEDADMVDLDRQPMTAMAPQTRSDNFEEIVTGYSKQQAILEASRCVQCGMCHDACPTHMHAPEYIRAIWQDDVEEAVRQMYRSNPFSHVCGRVCTHRCESACSIGRRGQPIAIRWLKRYAMDAVPHERVKAIVAEQKADSVSGHSVGIIGAGPAGLTAAFDLIRQGHEVVVYEALAAAGGMTRYGIPYYRLPAQALDQDVDVITSLGVEICYNTRIGVDLSMQELHQRHDAVILAIGLQTGRSTRIPGSDHPQVRRAVDLLRSAGAGEAFDVPTQAIVIGGGNVAMDIARTLARLQKQQYARVRVTVLAMEQEPDFLADPVEIKEAREEGVRILDARGPREVVIENGALTGLKTWRVDTIFDAQGRFAPTYDESDELLHPGELVVEAIGQMTDLSILDDELTEALEWNRGRIQVDEQGRTAVDWLWSAGDMVRGPDVVSAVADGHRVAESIAAFLLKTEVKP